MISRPLLRFAICLLLGPGSGPLVQAADAIGGPKNATVLIIRHAEQKPTSGIDPRLTPIGVERAEKYARYFHPFSEGKRTLQIDALFAAADSKASQRPRLTLEPLRAATGLPIDASMKESNPDQLTAKLQSGAFDGKTILICWRHGQIPALLQALGADPRRLLGKSWPDTVFGWVVELRYGADGSVKASRVINEQLMPDDVIAPPGQ